MILTKCPKCQKEININEMVCQNCGYQFNSQKEISMLFLPIFILGIVITLFGSFLIIDSLLYFFPEYYSRNIHILDPKELIIGLSFLFTGSLIALLGSILTVKIGHWLRSVFYKIPILGVIVALAIIMFFRFEIRRPHWYTKNISVSTNQTNNIVVRARAVKWDKNN